jgi:phosphate/sulfate permease
MGEHRHPRRCLLCTAQIFSACVMSFAHGSNDVANAMGPLSAVYYIWENQAVPAKSPVRGCAFLVESCLKGFARPWGRCVSAGLEGSAAAEWLGAHVTQVPEWILVLGGAGIVSGLALYGYKVRGLQLHLCPSVCGCTSQPVTGPTLHMK